MGSKVEDQPVFPQSILTWSKLTYRTAIIGLILVLVLLTVRYTNRSVKPDNEKHQSIQRASFDIPIVGHVLAFFCSPSGFLRFNRDRITSGIFGLRMFGVDTYIIHSPSLMKPFFALPSSVIEHKTMGANIITKIFGFPQAEVPAMITHFDELMNTFVTQLMKSPSLDKVCERMLTDINQAVPNIVSQSPESSYSSDPLFKKLQAWWQKSAGVQVASDGAVTASLFPLVRNCVGAISSREMMGSSFVAAHPTFLDDVWQVDANIMGFVFGYPGWLPWIARAKEARARILDSLVAWHSAMEKVGPVVDTNAEAGPFEDVGGLMKARQKIWSARGFSMQARAGVDLSILWALNANSNSTVYWMLRNIHATPGLLPRVRAEISPWARRTPNGGVSIDLKGLQSRSLLFKACYFETLRIDSAPWSFKRLRKGCTLTEASGGVRSASATFQLREGDAVLVPADLHHMDGRSFEDPEAFRPERFFVYDGPDVVSSAEIKTIRPYGGGATMCKGRMLAEKEVLAFVAAMLVCWDMEPAPGSSWDMDSRVRTSGVCSPRQDLRVRLTSRKVDDGM